VGEGDENYLFSTKKLMKLKLLLRYIMVQLTQKNQNHRKVVKNIDLVERVL
jgi:hypothetical protein